MHPTYDGRAGARGSHSNSSAFSPNANPNEDWTKISDLAERRRIQNRIAQRNYRKKLKRRLEDLERRAGTSASPERTHEEPVVPKASPSKTRTKNRAPPKREAISSISDYYNDPEDRSTMFAQRSTRQLSASPPPPAFLPSMPLDLNRLSYHPGPNPCYESLYPPHFTDHAPLFAPIQPIQSNNDMIHPFGTSYATMAGIDQYQHHQHHQQQHHQQQQPVHLTPQEGLLPVPSLGYSYADQRGASASPDASIFALPPTPESVLEYSESGPCSPRIMAYDYEIRT